MSQYCPVQQVIDEYYGGSEPDDESDQLIKLGGEDCVYAWDYVSYYMTLRKMEVARFKLTNPGPAEIQNKIKTMFAEILGQDYTHAYTKIVDVAIKKSYLQDQFANLVDIISKMENFIQAKINQVARAAGKLNICLPDLSFAPGLEQIIPYRPDVLCAAVNKIIEYVNKLDISSIISEMPDKITPIIRPNITAPNMNTKIIASAGLDDILGHEMILARYVLEIEKYQCYVINQMNQVFIFCKKIISALIVS